MDAVYVILTVEKGKLDVSIPLSLDSTIAALKAAPVDRTITLTAMTIGQIERVNKKRVVIRTK